MRFTWDCFFLLVFFGLATTYAYPVPKFQKDLQLILEFPCPNCGPDFTDQTLYLEFLASASIASCSSSNLILGDTPLVPSHQDQQKQGEGAIRVQSGGHELDVVWALECLPSASLASDPSQDDVQRLTLSIEAVDGRLLDSTPGLSLSFQTINTPTLLHLEATTSPLGSHHEESDDLQKANEIFDQAVILSNNKPLTDLHLETELNEIRRLEIEVDALSALLADKKRALLELSKASSTHQDVLHTITATSSGLLSTVLHKVESLTKSVSAEFNSHTSSQYNLAATLEQVGKTMAHAQQSMTDMIVPTFPSPAHLRNGRPSDLPIVDEKSGFLQTSTTTDNEFREGRGFLASIIKFFLIVTGLAALFRYFSRRKVSLRRIQDQAARREERRSAVAYKRSARRQALHDWWHGHHRRGGTGGSCQQAGVGNEKSHLINQQESILEEAMQDEIRQLVIQEEIRRMRQIQSVGDELLQAEEGRSGYARSITTSRRHTILPPYTPNSSSESSSPPRMHGFAPIVIPSTISTAFTSHTSAHNTALQWPASYRQTHQDMPPATPLSRTSSLPDYRSEAGFSDPPSYHTYDTDRETFTDTEDESGSCYDSLASPRSRQDGFEHNFLAGGPDGSSLHWTPANSIPYASPRPSVVMERTFV